MIRMLNRLSLWKKFAILGMRRLTLAGVPSYLYVHDPYQNWWPRAWRRTACSRRAHCCG